LPHRRLTLLIAKIYRRKVDALHAELNRPELRTEAVEVLRGLIEEIRLVPADGLLDIELAGDLAGILALAAGSNRTHPWAIPQWRNASFTENF
jgi:hypothetical protein